MTGADFRAWRKQLGFSQAWAARMLDISESRVIDYERGTTRGINERPAPIPRVVALACLAIKHRLDEWPTEPL